MGGDVKADDAGDSGTPTSLFLPNDTFRAGSSTSEAMFDFGDATYNVTPADNPSVFFGTRRLTKREKLEKKEDSSDDGDVTKVEQFSGEEELTSHSSQAPSSAQSSGERCPHGEDDSTASASANSSAVTRAASRGRKINSREKPSAKPIAGQARSPKRKPDRPRSGNRKVSRRKRSHSRRNNRKGNPRSGYLRRGTRGRSPAPRRNQKRASSGRYNRQKIGPSGRHRTPDDNQTGSRHPSRVSSSNSKIFILKNF